jgi:phage terminase large subunit-like protein
MMTMTSCKISDYLQEYIDLIESGERKSCNEQRLLIEYIKRVFETEKLIVNEIQIEKYLSYQKYFPFDLFPWEKFCFILHNCVFRTDGMPRWSDLFILMGRGGGKNGYLAFEDFCLVTETHGVAYYNIDICANSEEQAKTSFDEIYNVLENPKWRSKFEKNFHWNKTEIQNKKTKSKIKYRTNNPKGKDGLQSGKVDFDEPHAYENWENINVFTTGLGKKPHPRRTYISTNGDVREGPLDQLIEKSHKILSGEIADNGFLPFICNLDEDEEVHNEELWEKANPSLPYLPNLREQMRREYSDYLLDPIINNAFMTKRMNRPQGNKDAEVTSWENILKTNGELPDLKGRSCVCGIDFSKTTDFVSAFLLFKDRDQYYGIHHSWFCTASNDKHRIKYPLHEAVAKGNLTIVDDVEINPQIIADWVKEKQRDYFIEKIAIDNFRYTLLSRALRDAGFDANDKEIKLVRPSDIMQVVQKISSMFIGNKIIWGDDSLMRWFTRNTKLEPAPNNNFKYGKIEPKSRKTDGFMAFVNAVILDDELPETFEIPEMEIMLL